MDKRIHLELRGRQPHEVKDLDLSACKSGGDILGLTDEFTNLETLDLSNSTITNLKAFPKLENLKKVDLSGNRLSKGLESLADCTNLRHLTINNNKIKELDVLEPLKSLQHLTHLELGLEPPPHNLTKEECRTKIFEILPSLQYLDQEDIDGNEDEDDEEHVNGNGVAEEDDDLDDGDDELDDEEAEVEDEEESEGEVETPGLETLYQTAVLNDDEDDDEEDYDDEDLSEEEESDEEQESTRGKRSPTESTAGKTGKKRRLEEPSPDGDV